MPDLIDDARSLIQSRLADLDTEVQSLERALVGLGEGSPSRRGHSDRSPKRAAAPPSAQAKRPTRKNRTGRRARRGQRREELLAAIKAGPGARPSELAKSIGIRPTQVHALIAKARSEKLIVKKGNGYALRT
jgi:hypothetical protein